MVSGYIEINSIGIGMTIRTMLECRIFLKINGKHFKELLTT